MTMLFRLLLLLQLLACGDLVCMRRLLSKNDHEKEGEVFSDGKFYTEFTFTHPGLFLLITSSVWDMFLVFIAEGDANTFLGRHLLFNRFDFEMFVPGNLERECYEEVCNYEEAREVFENTPDTVKLYCFCPMTSSLRSFSEYEEKGLAAESTIMMMFCFAGCFLEEIHCR